MSYLLTCRSKQGTLLRHKNLSSVCMEMKLKGCRERH